MPISPLPPAVLANIAVDECAYEWDEWDARKYQSPAHDDLDGPLEAISERARVALTIAIGEWIYQRFTTVSSDRTPLDVCEAAWAGLVHLAYVIPTEMDDDDWRGPVRGPLVHAMDRVLTAVLDLYEREIPDCTRTSAVKIWHLARHLLPDTAAFDAWFETCLERLTDHYPAPGIVADRADNLFDLDVELGEPVPRNLFDTTAPFDPSTAAAAIDGLLRGLEQGHNPHVNTRDVIVGSGIFSGTPFRYP